MWQVSNVLLCTGRADAGEGVLVWRPKEMEDLIELVDIIPTFEEWLTAEKLCQDTSYGPDVDCERSVSIRHVSKGK